MIAATAATEGFTLENLQEILFQECEETQWDPEHANSLGEELAHAHEELSEAFKAWRVYKDAEIHWEPQPDGKPDKPQGVPIEFADVLIALAYNAELLGFSLMDALAIKHRYNLTRHYPTEGRQLHPS